MPAIDVNTPVQQPVSSAIQSSTAESSAVIMQDARGYHYEVRGNTLLSTARVQQVLAEASDPRSAVEALQKAYVDAGYFLVGLEPEVVGTTIRIRVLPRSISNVQAPSELQPYFRGLEGRPDLKYRKLARKFALAESYDQRRGRSLNLDLVPGQIPTQATLRVEEKLNPDASPLSFNFGLNNFGNRFAGRYIGQGAVSYQPGAGWELSANYARGFSFDDGDDSELNAGGIGLSKVTPWGIYGINVAATDYANPNYLSAYNLKGRFRIYSATGMQILAVGEKSRWLLNEAFTRTENAVDFGDTNTQALDESYNSVSLGLSYGRKLHETGSVDDLNLGLNLSKGLSSREGSFADEGPVVADPQYFLANASAAYAPHLPDRLHFGFSTQGQWADTTLPQNQQWVLGGLDRLSAWAPGVTVGDNGFLARLSATSPEFSLGGFGFAASMALEGGGSRPHALPPTTTTSTTVNVLTPLLPLLPPLEEMLTTETTQENKPFWQYLADAGLNLQMRYGKGSSLSVGAAWPIASSKVPDRVLDDYRTQVYFVLNQAW